MRFTDIFSLAFRTIRGNKVRTGLTVAIIAFGIMALIGIITAIKAMNQKFTESFSTMGANAFTIRYKERNIQFGGGNKKDITVSKRGGIYAWHIHWRCHQPSGSLPRSLNHVPDQHS